MAEYPRAANKLLPNVFSLEELYSHLQKKEQSQVESGKELSLTYARRMSGEQVRKRPVARGMQTAFRRSYPKPEVFYAREYLGSEASFEREVSTQVEKLIQASRSILEIEDNWDEEGSAGYSEATWERAIQFIKVTAISYVRETNQRIILPKITPGPEGSIDIRWKTAKRSLLINFPSNENEPADFFGSNKGRDSIKGTLDLSSQNLWLLMWLAR